MKKDCLNIGFVSPGWPLSQIPNGIIAYTKNILSGMQVVATPTVLAYTTIGSEFNEHVIDLSSYEIKQKVINKIFSKLIHKLNLPPIQKLKYQQNIEEQAAKINLAIENLKTPLDILEMEESFGYANFLIPKCKVPVVTRLHGPWFIHAPIMQMTKESDFKYRAFYEGEAIKISNGITSPSLDVLQKVREYYALDLPYASVIPNPVCEVPLEIQWRYDIKNPQYILMVGRFDLHKGGDLAIDTFRLIAQKNKEVSFIFVGPDRGMTLGNEFIKFDEYVDRFILETDVKKRIKFMGHCDSQTIAQLRMNSLVTLFPSRYENFPVSLLEALSAGCPTVTTAVGGIKDIVINEYNGLLAEPESAESMAEIVLALIENEEKMQFLSKNAIEDCKKRFSPETVAKQTLEYYRSVLARM
jgi:glycosyltransferase involved in cell wall biosynthesis